MKKQRLWSAVLMVLVAASLVWTTGCQSDQDKAKATLDDFVVADLLGDKESVLPYVAKADKEIINEELKDKKDSKFDQETMEKIAKDALGDQFSVKISEAKVDGDKMSVKAEITQPNEDAVKGAVIGKLFEVAKEKKDATDEEKNKALADALKKVFKEETFEPETVTKNFEMRKEGDKWLVFLDLKTQQEIKKIVDAGRDLSIERKFEDARAKLDEANEKMGEKTMEKAAEDIEHLELSILYNEARQFARDDKFAEAIANYKKVVEIDPQARFAPIKADKATEKIAELEEKKKKKAAQDAYREKVSLNGVEVKNVYGSRRIIGEIKNDGEKVLDKVELSIKFLGDDGKEVHQASTKPVYAFGKEDKAFKPGHSKKFRHYATNAPDAWADKVDVRVSSVEFFEEK